MLKRGRLRQTAGQGYTRWRKFKRGSGQEDGASQKWWQGRQYGRVFLELLARNFSACTQTTSGGGQTEQRGTDGETACSLCFRVAAGAHLRVSGDRFFTDLMLRRKSCARL